MVSSPPQGSRSSTATDTKNQIAMLTCFLLHFYVIHCMLFGSLVGHLESGIRFTECKVVTLDIDMSLYSHASATASATFEDGDSKK